MEFERSSRRFKEINLTALIDIVFHLMVFVMLTTSFVVVESIELSLPSMKANAALNATPDLVILRIEIIRDGSVILDQQPMTLTQMTSTLGERMARDPETKIVLLTSPGVTVEQLIAVMDTVYLTGGRNVQVDKVAAIGAAGALNGI